MIREDTAFQGVYILKPEIYRDNRGFFLETFREEYFEKVNLHGRYNQDNLSVSKKGVIRGLHFQTGESAQKKLILVCSGKILDVVVDIRRESPTFGKYLSFKLSAREPNMLFIPEGYAHGFSVLSDEAVVYYKCDVVYNPDKERGIRWNDPNLGINWEIEDPVLSQKDKNLPLLSDLSAEELF